ncbi:hypothetical protein GCM10026983_47270 [Gracilibacillus alcaliphilus]
MKYTATMLFIILSLLLFSNVVWASTLNIQQVERYVQEGKYQPAIKLLQSGVTDYQPDLIWQEYVDHCLAVLEDEEASHEEKELATQQLVILADSLVREYAPLWTTWQQELDKKVLEMLDQEQIAPDDMTHIVYQMEVLAPVVELHLEEEQFQSYQEAIALVQQKRDTMAHDELETTYQHISDIHTATLQQANASYTKWLVMVIISFFIASFTYVAIAKYRAKT